MKTPLRLLVLACLLFASVAFAEDPPPLGKAEARQVLDYMGWRNINILAIRQGVNEKGTYAPIYATILAYVSRSGKDQQLSQCLIYDRDLGWHVLEVGEKVSRMWNKEGYWEIKPWGAWVRTTTN